MHPNDQQIINALLARDEQMTFDFFFVWCRPLLYSLIRKIFDYPVDYDELVNELYLYLMENDGHRLKTFQGRSSIYQWLKCVATRFFLEKRDGGTVIDDTSSEPLYLSDEPHTEPVEQDIARSDLQRLLALMRNKRYRMVLQGMLLDGVEYKELALQMHVSVANLYNIKKRALAEFMAIALKEYGNE